MVYLSRVIFIILKICHYCS